MKDNKGNNHRPMLNAYPDSIGENLGDMIALLKEDSCKEAFQSFYVLPSMFHSDLDRGFSIIDYGLNQELVQREDLEEIKKLSMDLKLDFVLNHASVLSKEFQDILQNGEKSKYKDFFINWNTFWEGKGEMTADGYIRPKDCYIKDMFFRKPGLPILMVKLPDGKEIPYWNTFYQEVTYSQIEEQELMRTLKIQYPVAKGIAELLNPQIKEGKVPKELQFGKYETSYQKQVKEFLETKRNYLGQMDLNIKSPLVWEHYENVLQQLSAYGAKIVRLDAFAYAPKEPGDKNFLNEPGTWDLLEKVKTLADKYNLTLLPEIHAAYGEKIYEKVANQGYMTYDFFLPGLILDALEAKDGASLMKWAYELKEKDIRVVNMLGCHDGIPLLDLKGFLSEERIEALIEILIKRGGFVKNLHGQKNMYYQVNATYFSALGEDEKKLLLARAIQIFMPGKPQVWYLDLFAGKNDYEAVKAAKDAGHKEINRSNISLKKSKELLEKEVTSSQLKMLRFRNEFQAFGFESEFSMKCKKEMMCITWEQNQFKAQLEVDFATNSFEIRGTDHCGNEAFLMKC